MKCYTVLPAYRYAVLEGTGIGEASLAELWCVVVLVARGFFTTTTTFYYGHGQVRKTVIILEIMLDH